MCILLLYCTRLDTNKKVPQSVFRILTDWNEESHAMLGNLFKQTLTHQIFKTYPVGIQ